MRRKNFIKLSILAVLVISIAGGASAYHELIYEFDATHTQCHGVNDGESQDGLITMVLTPGGSLETLEAFTITFEVHNFTELDNGAYQNRTTVGLSKEFGDNAEFLRGVSDVSFMRRVHVDENGFGNETHSGDPLTLDAVAPKTAGIYNLTLIAVAGMNQTDEKDYNFTFAQGSIMVTVVAASTGGSISGGIIGITVGIVVAISTIVMLQMRKRMRKKDI